MTAVKKRTEAASGATADVNVATTAISTPLAKRPNKRRKVSKACANCRRRKIKCTGIHPCSNCVAYGCQCVFDDKSKNSPSSTNHNSTSESTSIEGINGQKSRNSSTGSSIAAMDKQKTTSAATANPGNNAPSISNITNINPLAASAKSIPHLPPLNLPPLLNQCNNPMLNQQYKNIPPNMSQQQNLPQLLNDNLLTQNMATNTQSSSYSALRSPMANVSPKSTTSSNSNCNTDNNSNKNDGKTPITKNRISTVENSNKPKKSKNSVKSNRKNEKKKKNSLTVTRDNGFYENDIESHPEFMVLVDTKKKLEEISEKNEMITKMIDDTRQKMVDFACNWQPTINLDRYKEELEKEKNSQSNNIRSNSTAENSQGKSIETKLMKNKYTNKIHITRFASLTTDAEDNKNSQEMPNLLSEKGFLAQLPLIDEIFSLYSPIETLSLRGLGYLVQRYTMEEGDLNTDAKQQIKATVYILLRFFDMCCLHLNEGVVTISNPLENYFQRTNNYNSRLGDSNSTPASTSSMGLKNTSNRELVSMIINKFPQPFTEELTKVSTNELMSKINMDLEMFKLLLKMYDIHRLEFEKMAMKLTYGDCDETPQEIDIHIELVTNFCELQDLLLTLCYSYYNSTLYHLDEYNSLDYLELLLSFLDHQAYMDQHYGYEKVLVVATDCAFKMGINRWEYYVGLDEYSAERRRKAMWRLFCHDKYFSFKMGYQSLIDDSKMNCLLPEPFRRVGFIDRNDFIERLRTIDPDDEVFSNMSIPDLEFYGQCSITMIVSQYYNEVLYCERYTSIRNTAKPTEVREEYLKEIFRKVEIVRGNLHHIKLQTKKLIDVKAGSRHGQVPTPGDDMYRSSLYVVFLNFYSTLYLRATINIVSRLAIVPKPDFIKLQVREYMREIYLGWKQCSNYLLTLETCYEMWRTFECYSLMFLLVSGQTVINHCFIELEDIVVVLRMFCKVLILSTKLTYGFSGKLNFNQTVKEFGRNFSLIAILIRLMLLDFMKTNKLSQDGLCKMMEQEGPEVVGLVGVFLDHRSYAFKYILEPVQESGFHLNVQQMLESSYSLSTENLNMNQANLLLTSKTISSDRRNTDTDGNTTANVGKDKSPPIIYPNTVLHDSQGVPNTRLGISSSLSPTSSTVSLPTVFSRTSNSNNSSRNLLTDDNNNNNNNNKSNVDLNLSASGINMNLNGSNGMIASMTTPPAFGLSPSGPNLEGNMNGRGALSSEPMQNALSSHSHGGARTPQSYNLGTLEEFVSNTDLNDLYKSLWSDNFVDMI